MEKLYYIILLAITGCLRLCYGCSIDGINNWLVPQTREIEDTFRGILFSEKTQNIQVITGVTQTEGLNKGPYVEISLNNSLFNIATNTDFENYEEFETQSVLGYTITFRCTDSSMRSLVFRINVKDTNNNDPIFLPTKNYEFTISPPVPPGFLITTCLNDVLVRDIDLTTQRVDFKIEGSNLFEISFDPSSQVPKEFKATLKTTDLIRSIPEPINLTVTATDVDLTEGPPRSATATIVVTADSQFQFPDEPIFSQTFYLANYKNDNEVLLQNKIFLRQGYDGQVKFSFESDHSEYFELVINQNDLSFNMKAPIPLDLYEERQIYLVVKATREHTSGATAAVILKLPEVTRLEFEDTVYKGTITDNILQLTDLKLKQGYEGYNITVDIKSEYTFRAYIETNVIKISMDPLPTDVIQNNNFISLQIIASNNRTTAVTVIILEIIKDDFTTPVFERNIYTGSYSTETGLTLEEIILTQGFDETVKITLEGKHSYYFNISQDGPRITLTSSSIPSDIFNERNIIITVLASKPRTVGAHATINIALPSARYLGFEKNIYGGSIESNNLTLNTIVLSEGYASDVNFTLTGELIPYFAVNNDKNLVTIDIEKEIPESVLLENDLLVLTLSASGTNAVPTSTSIVLQIIKEDRRTPVFSENLYSFKYKNDESSLGNLTLAQGFDETVTFDLIGDHKDYFDIEPSFNLIKLILKSSIPEDIMFDEKNIILNIVAQKPRTVGANAAIYITFPKEMIEPTIMSFTQNAYKGLLEDSNLTVDDIILETGYTSQTRFLLSGEYSENFSITTPLNSNVVKITPASDWSLEDLEANQFIILEVKAIRDRAVSTQTVVVIDVVKTIVVPPVFEKAFYKGNYTSSEGLLFEEEMSLQKGFDNTVEFSLEEESSKWFILERKEQSVNLLHNTTNPIPDVILENNEHLFFTITASKPGTITGRSVIYINLPKEESAPIALQFENRQYVGTIQNGTLHLEDIRLIDTDVSLVHFNLTGKLSKYFTVSKLSDAIVIKHVELPKEIIENNTFIMLNVEASKTNAISAHATIVIEINKTEEEIIVPIFEEAFYTGQYQNTTGLIFSSSIKLAQGYDDTITFGLSDEDSKWFSLIHNGPNDLSLRLKDEGLNEITDRSHLVFTVVANKPNCPSARSAVIISLSDKKDFRVLRFEKKSYLGRIEEKILHIENLRLLEENMLSIEFNITGEYSTYFKISKYSDYIQINLVEAQSEMIEDNDFIVLNLEASQLGAISGHTTIVLEVIKEGVNIRKMVFSEIYYTGEYLPESKLIFPSPITLVQGYDESVKFELEEDDSKWFSLVQDVPNNLTLKIKNDSINEILGRSNLIFTVVAHKTNSTSARSAVVISLLENSIVRIVQFEHTSYLGNIENGMLEIEEIRLLSGLTSSMDFNITGDHASYFSILKLADSIKINLIEAPAEVTDNNDFIILNVKAFEPGAVSGYTTIVLNIVKNEEYNTVTPVFSEAYYTGQYSKENGLIFLSVITLVEGYDETVTFILDNDDSKGFAVTKNGINNFTLILNGSLSEPEDRNYLLFTVIAHKPNANNGSAAIVIFIEPPEVDNVSFDRILYNGKLQNGILSHDTIILSGFNGTNIEIIGEHNALFKSELTNGVVKVEAAVEKFPTNLTHIPLELRAATASAILLIDVSLSEPPEVDNVSFDRILYKGKLQNGVLSHDTILLSGFNGTNIEIIGDYKALFKSELANGVVNVETSVEEFPTNLTHIALELRAATASAILLIDVSLSEPPEVENVSFDRILYNGKLHNGILSHDKITLSGFKGTNIQIIGEHNALFISKLTNGIVTVEASVEEFPTNLTHLALQLRAATASAILLIDVSFSENPELPIVSFKSQSYFLWADIDQTGVVGAVEASADNGEAIVYSLSSVNEQIQSRININNNGEILLTSAFDKGVYTFNAVATSVLSQVQATAPVLLRVDTVPECSDEVGLSPLIILERLEEEPHLNLVVLNQTEHKGCQYTLLNVFPKNQSWLYVDKDGLHTKAIDRESESIAFMTLSQIQVELTLDCDSDEVPAFNKRSLGTEDKSDLYSYDDGPYKWVLTDTILYNARRSFVNLIVKDINDNSPIFLGKEKEPIYVGYPVSELEDTVLPRALIELKATDADVGENAAIIYWSGEDNLAVSPNTGLVHVRNNAKLENNSRLTIYAIDQNGKGRNGTIDIVVKLLDKNQIAVLTIRNAFLEDEVDVLNALSIAVGYEIKVLKAVVISNNNEELTRKKRDVSSNRRASLLLYVYGLLESQPVDINQLTRDINNSTIATVNIARIISLEDHLEGLEIYPPGRDTALLAATISLAVLLFILIVAIAVWFFLKWRRNKNYEQFSERSSSVSQLASPNLPKIEVVTKSRPDIDEIKKTERRLQEMLETPTENALVPEVDDDVKPPIDIVDDAIVNISSPDAQLPIVIQSIDKLKDNTDDSDDNDEFGEIIKPRKSVVTFNENVEKIIHIEDVPDDASSENSFEIYKF